LRFTIARVREIILSLTTSDGSSIRDEI